MKTSKIKLFSILTIFLIILGFIVGSSPSLNAYEIDKKSRFVDSKCFPSTKLVDSNKQVYFWHPDTKYWSKVSGYTYNEGSRRSLTLNAGVGPISVTYGREGSKAGKIVSANNKKYSRLKVKQVGKLYKKTNSYCNVSYKLTLPTGSIEQPYVKYK